MAVGERICLWGRALARLFKPFLTASEFDRLAKAVARAEEATSAEIVVHIEAQVPGPDLLRAAEETFLRLGLDKTRERSAVLILVSELDRRFALWGDRGVHEKAGQQLWEKEKQTLTSFFRDGRYCEGLEACVAELGETLAVLFPKTGTDTNELPDRPTRD